MDILNLMKKDRLILNLSLKDLKHEWLLTICQIMAIAAVLSPLLLLFGLKYGIVNWGINSLKNDPVYREIRPVSSRTYKQDWFNDMRNRKDVSFIIPMTRHISASVTVALKGKKRAGIKLDIVPTISGDPLLLENGVNIPGEKECALSQYAAEALNAEVGDILIARAGRIAKGQYQYGRVELKIIGIMSLRATQLNVIYLPLALLESIEQYKDGRSVPSLGWGGQHIDAYPAYDGALVILEELLSPKEKLDLINRTGFTQIKKIKSKEQVSEIGIQVNPKLNVYRLSTLKKSVDAERIKSVKNRLRGKTAIVMPWLAPMKAFLTDQNGLELQSLNIVGVSSDEMHARRIGLKPVPIWGNCDGRHVSECLSIMLPPEIKIPVGSFFLSLDNEAGGLTIPIDVSIKRSPWEGFSIIPSRLAGILRLSKDRSIAYDGHQQPGRFFLHRKGYASFRLYARSFSDVNTIRTFFEDQGVHVHTKMMEINKVLQLDKGFALIFWLLASVGIVGSVASLIAALYASVDRKKREISVLRLLGLTGKRLFRFPLYQGVVIGSSGYIASLLVFVALSRIVNQLFRPYAHKLLNFPLDQGVDFCRLPFRYAIGILVFTVLIAITASFVAAVRVVRIDPAEALRDE